MQQKVLKVECGGAGISQIFHKSSRVDSTQVMSQAERPWKGFLYGQQIKGEQRGWGSAGAWKGGSFVFS